MPVATAVHPKKPRLRVVLLCISAVLLLLVGTGLILAISNWPFTRQKVETALRERTERDVLIQRYTNTYFPPGCVVEGIRFLHHKDKSKPPIITISKMAVRTSWARLMTRRRELERVDVQGFHVLIPPRGPNKNGKTKSVMPLTDKGGPKTLILELHADGAVLEFRHRNPELEPYVVTLHRLSLTQIGSNGPLHYDAAFRIDEPAGEIAAQGQFGPWNSEEPGETAVSGTYRYRDADMNSAFHKLNGTLASDGKFQGTLASVEAEGSTDLPNFHILGKGHTVHLKATYQAQVNATDGDTIVRRLEVHSGRTTVIAHGTIAKEAAHKQKVTRLEGDLNGRIEEAMLPFLAGPRAPMTGKLLLHAKVEFAPGPGTFLHKLKGQGAFGIGGGQFTNRSAQLAIDRLSKSARGDKNRKAEDEDPATFVEKLRGGVSLNEGVATFTHVTFEAPDSAAQVHGTINLVSQEMSIGGLLRTHGKIADETTGFKSFMLKAMTPFLKKKDANTRIPFTQVGFKITGPCQQPKVGLDLHAKGF